MTRRLIINILGVIILFALGYVIYPFIVGGSKMEEFCSSVSPGVTKTELVNHAAAARYSTKESEINGSEMVLVIDSRAMGRYICEVTFDANLVATSKYVFND